jgi:hypothetical protein
MLLAIFYCDGIFGCYSTCVEAVGVQVTAGKPPGPWRFGSFVVGSGCRHSYVVRDLIIC